MGLGPQVLLDRDNLFISSFTYSLTATFFYLSGTSASISPFRKDWTHPGARSSISGTTMSSTWKSFWSSRSLKTRRWLNTVDNFFWLQLDVGYLVDIKLLQRTKARFLKKRLAVNKSIELGATNSEGDWPGSTNLYIWCHLPGYLLTFCSQLGANRICLLFLSVQPLSTNFFLKSFFRHDVGVPQKVLNLKIGLRVVLLQV